MKRDPQRHHPAHGYGRVPKPPFVIPPGMAVCTDNDALQRLLPSDERVGVPVMTDGQGRPICRPYHGKIYFQLR